MQNPLTQWMAAVRAQLTAAWVEHGLARYQGLSVREQRIVRFAVVVLPMMFLVFAVILPLNDKKVALQKSVQVLQQQAVVVLDLSEQVKNKSDDSNMEHGNLLGSVEKLARQSHVRQAMTHIRPRPEMDGHQRLQVQLKGARYSDVLTFLDALARQGFAIESAKLSKNSDKLDGLVRLQLTVME